MSRSWPISILGWVSEVPCHVSRTQEGHSDKKNLHISISQCIDWFPALTPPPFRFALSASRAFRRSFGCVDAISCPSSTEWCLSPSPPPRPSPRPLTNRLLFNCNNTWMFFQVDPYEVIAILLETLIYGVFLVLFTLSTLLLLQRRKALMKDEVPQSKKLRSLTFYLVMSMLMFCTITAVSPPPPLAPYYL